MISYSRKTFFSLGVGLLFSAAALYFTFENIPMKDLGSYLQRINYWWIVPSLAIALLSYMIRIWRWQIILLPVKRSGIMSAFHPLVIGFMLNCVMPGRIGEVARPAIYYKRENVAFSRVLGTVAIERIIDALCLLIFFIYILAIITIDESVNVTFGGYTLTSATLNRLFEFTLELSIALVAATLLISFSKTRGLINRVIMKSPEALFFITRHAREAIRERICRRLTHFVDNLSVGFDILKRPGYLLLCLIQTFVLWWMLGVSVWVMTFGCPGIHVTILEAFAVEIIICFAIMLPSVPGYWGLWEAGGVFGLALFGIPSKEAAGMILTYHFFHLIPIILIGLASSMVVGLNFTQTTRTAVEAMHIKENIDRKDSGDTCPEAERTGKS